MLKATLVPRVVFVCAALFAPVACLSPIGGGGSAGESMTEVSSSTGSSGHVPTSGQMSGGGIGCEPGCGPEEVCIAGICEAVSRVAIEMGCHPLGDPAGRGECVYPWPSDFYTRPEASSATGRVVALPGALLPTNSMQREYPADSLLNGAPGFTPHAQIRFVVAGGIEPASLPPITDPERSLAASSPIVLLRVSTGERWPFFAEVDASTPPGMPQTIFIRPLRRLVPGERWVVAIRGLKTPSGEPLPASPLFRALRDDLTTDLPELEGERGRYTEIFGLLAAAGIERGSLQNAWDFTTNTEEAIGADFTAIAPQIAEKAAAGDLGYMIESVIEKPGEAVPLVIKGRFTVPSCLAGSAGPGSLLVRDGAGAPLCSGTAEAPFWIAVPAAIYTSKVPTRAAVYGHGLLGTGEEAVYVAAQSEGLILAGTDFWGMSEEDVPTIAGVIGENFAGGRTLADRLLQSTVNFTTLAYLLQGEMTSEPALQGLIDPSTVFYIGGSQGGIMGATVTAMAPNIQRGVLVVGAANYSLMVWRSSAFEAVNELWEVTQPSRQRREFLMALYQAVFDRVDPISYRGVIEASGDRLLLVESIGDCQVPNVATEMMARSYGMKMVPPSVYPVWEIEDAPADFTGSALLQVDTKLLPLPPTQNLPPTEDNGAHGASTDSLAVQETIVAFLQKGVVQNSCTGPCDPE